MYDAIAELSIFCPSCPEGVRCNGELDKFVMQDAAKAIEGLPWFQRVARRLTDAANVADVAMNGQGQGGTGPHPVTPHYVLQGAGRPRWPLPVAGGFDMQGGGTEEKKYKVVGRRMP